MTTKNFVGVCEPFKAISQSENSRLAKAARYAVLGRMMPVLRHDVAGVLPLVQMLLMVLQRRVQNAHPNLAAITENVMSFSILAKKAASDNMSALLWTDSADDSHISVKVGVDEALRLLTREMSLSAPNIVNGIKNESATLMQSTFRSVVIGALLAYCDQNVADSSLQLTFHDVAPGSHIGQLRMQVLSGDVGKLPVSLNVIRQRRVIEWADVQAMAESSCVKMAQRDNWLTLDLLKCL